MTKQTDYGIVLMAHFARDPEMPVYTARDVAAETKIPLPMVGKVLKALTRHDLLVSHRGVKGGYSLARPAEDITVAEIINALEGPLAVTECSIKLPSGCFLETICPVLKPWQRINRVLSDQLGKIKLSEMATTLSGAAR